MTKRSETDLVLELFHDLSIINSFGVQLDLLLNCSCFGEIGTSKELLDNVSYIIDSCTSNGVPISSVTTMTPSIAQHIRRHYKDIKLKCSINNHSCSSPRQLDMLRDYYDGFYYNRDYNYDFTTLKCISSYCKENNKELYLLANSGCFTDCPVRQVHQNSAAHLHDTISRKDIIVKNVAICGQYLEDKQHRLDYLSFSNIIRPEDLYLWEPYVTCIKLATRVTPNLKNIVEAYVGRSYDGDLMSLTEPAYVFQYYPQIVNNKMISSDYVKERIMRKCGMQCSNCGLCKSTMENALVTLQDSEWLTTHDVFLSRMK